MFLFVSGWFGGGGYEGGYTHAKVVLGLEGTVFGWFGGFPVEVWEGDDWRVGVLVLGLMFEGFG